MKIKCTDYGVVKEIDTDKERDYKALQYEKYEDFSKFCSSNKIYFWTFTLDAENNTGNFRYLPLVKDEKRQERLAHFLSSMDRIIRETTENKFCIGMVGEYNKETE